MWTIRATTSAILALSLLAVSSVGASDHEDQAAEASTPVYVTWEVVGDPAQVIDGAFDEATGEMRGMRLEGTPVEASDPRMSGLVTAIVNGSVEVGPDGPWFLESRSFRVVNEEGAWTGQTTYVESAAPAAGGPSLLNAETGLMIGEGAYDGLVAYVFGDYREGNRGEAIIFEVAVPPVPDVPEVAAE